MSQNVTLTLAEDMTVPKLLLVVLMDQASGLVPSMAVLTQPDTES